jgi:hypothetical protein
MHELNTTYVREEQSYRAARIRDGIVGRRERAGIRRRTKAGKGVVRDVWAR